MKNERGCFSAEFISKRSTDKNPVVNNKAIQAPYAAPNACRKSLFLKCLRQVFFRFGGVDYTPYLAASRLFISALQPAAS